MLDSIMFPHIWRKAADIIKTRRGMDRVKSDKINLDTAKVMVIEPDPPMLYLFEQVLAKHRFESITAKSSVEGFRLACEERPDAIIVNTALLDGDKFDLLKKLRAHETTMGVPIFATTHHWKDFGEDFFLSLGFDGLIKLPLDIAGLAATLKAAIDIKR